MKTSASPRVLIAGLFHETHTFLPGVTSLNECGVAIGDELLGATGDVSPLGGALEEAGRLNWQVLPALDVRAAASAIVEDRVVEVWWQECQGALKRALEQGLDGIFLVLHGAMASSSFPDVEGEVLKRIHAVVGPHVPIGGVTDLHANFSPRMAQFSHALLTYRCNPHTDGRETAVRATHLLHSLMTSETRAATFFRQVPVMWPPTGTGTSDSPMQELEMAARAIEQESALHAVNVHAGYSFADVADVGVSFSVIAPPENAEVAEKALDHLERLAFENRHAGNVIGEDFETLLPSIRKALCDPGEGPVVLAEPCDNIGGGAPGDGTALLQLFIKHQLGKSVVVINDPVTISRLSSLEIGATSVQVIGGASNFPGAGPVELEVKLISRTSGEFDLEDIHSHAASGGGRHIKMGPCVTLQHKLPNGEGILILLTSYKSAPFDLGQLRSQGIEPEKMALIGAKAAVAHQQVYAPIARAMLSVETPGPCTSDLRRLPYRNVRRPIFPLN